MGRVDVGNGFGGNGVLYKVLITTTVVHTLGKVTPGHLAIKSGTRIAHWPAYQRVRHAGELQVLVGIALDGCIDAAIGLKR